jgi:hypothetical protein
MVDMINDRLNALSDAIREDEIEVEYLDFIQEMLHEFYMQEYATMSHDNDSIFYGEVV